jgi:hypothetical protein
MSFGLDSLNDDILKKEFQKIAGLPSEMDIDSSKKFLSYSEHLSKEAIEILLSRGALLSDIGEQIRGISQNSLWLLLRKALDYYSPIDPCDEAFRRKLDNYAKNTNHDYERWSSIAKQ